ncbi:1,4-alpha-glucan branching enzyme [Rhodoblastus sphagnicola]|nr:alpha amylase C-terminal domain-containing protein [Rhodoblastus sphagnicola]MBB4199948.1 1,4-alpha-glucan branching enzyme [Rhodoblastus sphagnicola]
MGATVVQGGATFRVWAPLAKAVYLNGVFAGAAFDQQTDDRLLSKDPSGYWSGFQVGAREGDRYRFWVDGLGSSGYKRDPYAKELDPVGFPNAFSVIRDDGSYPWHDAGFRTPDFADMIIYQAHVGTFAVKKPGVASNLLDVACKVPYLAALGVNVLQPLPIDEQENHPSMGYGGVDLFSPDFPYVAGAEDLQAYWQAINAMLVAKGFAPLPIESLTPAPNQVKVLVDLCHIHGIAVAFDVVYNHAGGFDFQGALDDNCLYYFDRAKNSGNNNDSLYFTDKDRGTGGLAFALWKRDVVGYLLDNARYYVDNFHADGFRYDEISTLLSTNQGGGWAFCRSLTSGLRQRQPRLLQNAEFWPGEFPDIPGSALPIIEPASSGGAGFDVVQHDDLRNEIRGAVQAAATGWPNTVPMGAIAAALYPPGFDHAWRAVTCIENHDLVMAGRQQRIAALADPSDHRSWYARSRSRVANGLLLTAPGIPQIFMGQECLEDKQWDTAPLGPNLVWWQGLEGADRAMADHLRFMTDLIALRRTYPALRGDRVNPFHGSDADRILAAHRWLEGSGQDVVVVASMSNWTWYNYELGFPIQGAWREAFNSDVYDHWPNPQVAGNGGWVHASGPPRHGFTASAQITIPANSVLVFVRG